MLGEQGGIAQGERRGGKKEQRRPILCLESKKIIRWRKQADEGREWQGQFGGGGGNQPPLRQQKEKKEPSNW